MRRLTLLFALALFSAVPVHAQTPADAWTAYHAFHRQLCDPSRNIYRERSDQTEARARFKGAAAIWCQAVFFDMAVNACRRARSESGPDSEAARQSLSRMRAVWRGEKAHYVNFDFDNPNTDNGWFVYDDIMWWVVALARAAAVDPATPEFLELSEKGFIRVWRGSPRVGDTGSYADPAKGLGGGMFWQWQPIERARPNRAGDFRSACITFPTVIACCLLHGLVPSDRTGDDPARPSRKFYREKALELYDWGRRTLVPDGARVADGIHGGGPEFHDHLYNQASYIGAACLLYKMTGQAAYLSDAVRAAEYTRDRMCRRTLDGIKVLPFERGVEQGIYAAIFAQYMELLVLDCGQTGFRKWLDANIRLGWNNRDRERDLQDARFIRPLPSGFPVNSYDASALPALMLIFTR